MSPLLEKQANSTVFHQFHQSTANSTVKTFQRLDPTDEDKDRDIIAFIHRSIRTAFYSPTSTNFTSSLMSSFSRKYYTVQITFYAHCYHLLLYRTIYNLRNRPHDRQLPDRISRLTDRNFTVRMLWHACFLFYCYFIVQSRSVSW